MAIFSRFSSKEKSSKSKVFFCVCLFGKTECAHFLRQWCHTRWAIVGGWHSCWNNENVQKCVKTEICVCMPVFKLLLLVAAIVHVQDLTFVLVTVSNFTMKLFPSTPCKDTQFCYQKSQHSVLHLLREITLCFSELPYGWEKIDDPIYGTYYVE